jgi:ADP-ribosylglycohydrolase
MATLAHNPLLGDRVLGALLGLAYGDALGFPAMFHRSYQFPLKRREFIWRTNRDLMRQRIVRLTLPFTHRLATTTLQPFATDDTEYAIFTAQTLLAVEQGAAIDVGTFTAAWQAHMIPAAEHVLCGFAERAALDNLRRGVLPPASGNDNPQHYDDSACARAVAVGLFCAGQPQRAVEIAAYDACVTNAEDGIYAAQAVAVAVAVLAGGADVGEGLARARACFPAGSWLAHGEATAQECLRTATSQAGLALVLQTRLVNTVYSYGNAAPETVPAALAIVEACGGALQPAVTLALSIPKAADSLPALVGALCGAYEGAAAIDPMWRLQLNEMRGLCLPFLAGVTLEATAQALAGAASASGTASNELSARHQGVQGG